VETSKTAAQALDLLLAIADRGPMTPTDIARVTNLNRTVVHRLLATLHSRGFVRRSGDLYEPGAVLARFAEVIEPELRRVARPVMHRLGAVTGETVVLSVPDDGSAVAVEQVVGTGHPVRVEYELGSRRPLVLGASGRAILAFLDAPLIERAIGSATDVALVSRQLEEVRRLGYAVSHDELRQGVHGVAAPVLGAGHAVASLSVLTPAGRAGDLVAHTASVVAGAQDIADSLVRDGQSDRL
jgi:DNA-binding IclR family transcriptional regulator